MSALARYFEAAGKKVAGYDKTPSAITQELSALGIEVHYEDYGSSILKLVPVKETVLIVYTPAVPIDFGELVCFRESGYTLKKRAEVLGMIANAAPTLAVAYQIQ